MNEPLVRAIACGRVLFEELASGRAASFGEIAKCVGVTDRYVNRIVDFAFLATDVIEAMWNGDEAADITVKRRRSVPAQWRSGGGRVVLRASGPKAFLKW